ncbi:MAG: aldolase/citrate lyase family protein [Sulfuricurvum sp.]
MLKNEKIIEAFAKRDLDALSEFAKPQKRELNSSLNFSSAIMVSCNKIEHLLKLDDLKADAIILNLEDGVSSEDKPFALLLCAIILSNYTKSNKKFIVRVNALDAGGFDEIAYLNQFAPDAIRVPKIRSYEEVFAVCELLRDDTELHLSIETKEAWLGMSELAKSQKVRAFYLGVLDLFADLGLSQDLININNPTMNYMLSHFLITSRSLGIKPVSFVYQEHENLAGFREWVSLERQMGYDAKGCISPKQVDIVNEIYAPDLEAIKRAKEIKRLFELNQKEGITGFASKEFGFIDEPIYKGALMLLSRSSI